MKKNFNLVIISAIALRLILASFFYHPDIKSQNFHSSFLSQGVTNIYEYLDQNRFSLGYSDTFNYPPLIYFFEGSWQVLSEIIVGPGLVDWLKDWSDNAIKTPQLYSYLLVLKLPYFIADLSMIWFIIRLVEKSKRHLAVLLWLFNPFTLYATYMVGQFDILPTLLTIASVWFASKNKLLPASILLGIGSGLKTYPILLFPFLLFKAKNLKQAALLILGFVISWAVPLLPFVNTPAFESIVFNSSHGNRIFSTSIGVTHEQSIIIFVVYYIFILYLSLLNSNKNLISSFLAVILGLLMFSHFHLQWALWSAPFLVIAFANHPNTRILILAVVVSIFGLAIFIPDQYILISQLTPLNPFLRTIPSIYHLLFNTGVNLPLLSSLIRTILVATGLIVIMSEFNLISSKTSHAN